MLTGETKYEAHAEAYSEPCQTSVGGLVLR